MTMACITTGWYELPSLPNPTAKPLRHILSSITVLNHLPLQLYHASPLAGTGDVTYHGPKGSQQAHWGMRFPNGLVYGHDGLIYVPSVIDGGITVFQIQPDKSLKEISRAPLPCPPLPDKPLH